MADDLEQLRTSLMKASDQILDERDASFGDPAKVKAADDAFDLLAVVLARLQVAINRNVAADLNAIAEQLKKSIAAQRAVGLSTAAATIANALAHLSNSENKNVADSTGRSTATPAPPSSHLNPTGGAQGNDDALGDGLRAALKVALRLNEIGDRSPYQLSFAAKGASGASFGFMQGDLAAGQPEVTRTFHDVLAAAKFPEERIKELTSQLSVHLVKNPLSAEETQAIDGALSASRALVDAMDEDIFSGVCQNLQKCIQAAGKDDRHIAPKAAIYIGLWINMSGPPTNLLKWLEGNDPALPVPVPQPRTVVGASDMEAYLRATSYFIANPGNFLHLQHCAAAAAATLSTRHH